MDLVIKRESCLKLSGEQQESVWQERLRCLCRCLQWKTVLGVSLAGGVVPPGSYFEDFKAVKQAGWGLTQSDLQEQIPKRVFGEGTPRAFQALLAERCLLFALPQ